MVVIGGQEIIGDWDVIIEAYVRGVEYGIPLDPLVGYSISPINLLSLSDLLILTGDGSENGRAN